jgi:N-acylglucosamine 2-epimerase
MDKSIFEKYINAISDDLFKKVIPFWENHGYDRINGGIKTCLDREGSHTQRKRAFGCRAAADGCLRICANSTATGMSGLRSQKALSISLKSLHRPSDGRMYFVVGDDGTPFRKRRYVFSEYFYILANAEYYTVTGDEETLKDARKYYNLVKSIYDDPSTDPFKITPKFLVQHRR